MRNNSRQATKGGWISGLLDISSGAKKFLFSFLGRQSIPTATFVEPAETSCHDKQEAVNTVISSGLCSNESLHGQPSTKDLTLVTSYSVPSNTSSEVLVPTPLTRALFQGNGFAAPTSVAGSAERSRSDKQEAVNTVISNRFGFNESLLGQPSRKDLTLVTNYPIPAKTSSVIVVPRRPTRAVYQENGLAASSSVGRFPKHHIARGPYARVPSTTTFQAPKRRSSDNDLEPVRFVRRVRPKVNLLPGFGGVSSGSGLNSSSASCPSSAEKLLLVGKSSKHSVDSGQQGSVLDAVPSRSRELASRILQQLEVEITPKTNAKANDTSNGKARASCDGKQKLDTAVASTATEKGPPLSYPSLQAEGWESGPDLSSDSASYPSSAEKSLLMGKSSTFRFSLAEVCLESDDEAPVPCDGKQKLDTGDMTNSVEVGSPVLINSSSSSFQDKQMGTAVASATTEEVPAFSFPSLQLIQQAEARLLAPNIRLPQIIKFS